MSEQKTITVALTGASGMPYGIRLLEILLKQGHRVYLLYSQAAQIVAQQEMALTLSPRPKETEAFLNGYFNVEPGLLKVLAGKNGLHQLLPAPTRPMQW